MPEWILPLVAFIAGSCIGWVLHRQTVPGKLRALRGELESRQRNVVARVQEREGARRAAIEKAAREARAMAFRLAEKFGADLEEARRELDPLEDQTAEECRSAAERGGEAQQATQELSEAEERIRQLEDALRNSARAEDLRLEIESERELRRGSAGRVAELEAAVRRLTEDLRMAEAAPAEQPGPAAETTAPSPPTPGGLTVLDALDADPTLDPGQRETIRAMYGRFAPKVTKSQDVPAEQPLRVRDVLDQDSNLNRGQREAIRAIYDQFVRKLRV